ncbi:MAG: glycoside hydrolase family 3 protein [Candidatus Marinimicrobia bacterium]|nr:glycoside hydrolase family 3 protein [Candidatus Neomarinimicrobiota bacterium]
MNFSTEDIKTMIGQMIMVGLRGTSTEDAKSFFDSMTGFAIGGVILYDENVTTSPSSPHNIRSPEQVKSFNASLQSFSPTPLLIGVDQEGGQVNRLKGEYGFPHSKSWAEIGQLNDVTETQSHSKYMAATLSDHGFNLNFAPVLDLSINPKSFIAKKDRCFSSDPKNVSVHSEIFMKAHLNENVVPVCKHFPGQGSAGGDTHEGIVDVTKTWSETELIPYQTLINHDCIPAIMTSHLFHKQMDSKLPATLSSKVLNGLLRDKMGFNGAIISDDPQMGAIANHYDLKTIVRLMIHAGVDIFCFGNNLVYDPDIVQKVHTNILNLLNEGAIGVQQIEQSYNRIMQLKKSIGLL